MLGSPLAVFWLVSALSLLSCIPFLFVASPGKPVPEASVSAEGQVADADGSGDASEKGDGVKPLLAAEEEEARSGQWLQALCTIAVVLLVFCTTAAETAIGNWLFTFASKGMSLSDANAALANSAFWGAFTFGRVVGVSAGCQTIPRN